ncbi:MAG: ABC transporter permease subunit [Burkholderiales bacterium]
MSAGSARQGAISASVLVLVYAFLYIPIITLVVFSFNESKLVTLWSGFSLKWYAAVWHDKEIINGLWLSLKIAFFTATASVILGTFAAVALTRYKRFPGRTLFTGMVSAPLVMPEVIVGLSLLLTMVTIQKWLGYPERGMFTIWMGHTLLGMAYATVVIQSRLTEMDKSLDEAAMDLGCKPLQVFRLITLPLITQSLMSAWLLTFTLSLDDVVLSMFLSGPGSTTLPIVIFSRARLGLNPEVNAVAAVTIAVVSALVIFGSIYMARAEREKQREISAAFREANQAT